MKVIIENGYYKFYPLFGFEITLAESNGLSLVQNGDYFTFPLLAGLKTYSLEGQDYHGVNAIKTYSGRPEDVLLQNKLAYDYKGNKLISIDTFFQQAQYRAAETYFFDDLPQAGSMTRNGQKIQNLSAEWDISGSMLITIEDIKFYG